MRYVLLCVLLACELQAQTAVYPLHHGDMWQYRSAEIPTTDTTLHIYRAVRDTLLAGHSYAIIEYSDSPGHDLVRQSADSVYLFRQGKDVLHFNFALAPGDTVSSTVFGRDTMDIVLQQVSVQNWYGGPHRIWVYLDQVRHVVDAAYRVTVMDSLGIVDRVGSFGYHEVLVGAVINGRVYGTVTDAVLPAETLPDEFTLVQNFPDPFNPSTTIRFALPRSTSVSIEIFNALGQMVSETAYSRLSPGSHDVPFDGSALPSGAYYYRVSTPTTVRTGRMILAR
jgi:hypothetical protein